MENGNGADRKLKHLSVPDNRVHGNVFAFDAKTRCVILAGSQSITHDVPYTHTHTYTHSHNICIQTDAHTCRGE